MKKILAVTLAGSFVFGAYYLAVKDKRSAEILNALGVECKPKNGGYFCVESEDKWQLLRIKYYIKNNLDIDAYILEQNQTLPKEANDEEITKPKPEVKKAEIKKREKVAKEKTKKAEVKKNVSIPKKGYCVQVVSSNSKDSLLNEFEKLKSYPASRLEKIGRYYVIRVGQSRSSKSLKSLLEKIRTDYPNAFVRKCDYILRRMIKRGGN